MKNYKKEISSFNVFTELSNSLVNFRHIKFQIGNISSLSPLWYACGFFGSGFLTWKYQMLNQIKLYLEKMTMIISNQYEFFKRTMSIVIWSFCSLLSISYWKICVEFHLENMQTWWQMTKFNSLSSEKWTLISIHDFLYKKCRGSMIKCLTLVIFLHFSSFENHRMIFAIVNFKIKYLKKETQTERDC